MPDYIFDTTTLSHFASAEKFDLLEKRYRGQAFTTVEVIDELRKGVKSHYSLTDPGGSVSASRAEMHMTLKL